MRVLVTGGTGFLGRRLVAQLLARGCDVRCLARSALEFDTPKDGGRLEVRQLDLNRLDRDPSAVEGCDIVYHLASGLKGATASLFLTNVVGTRALMEAVARAGTGRFVLVSSLGTYGTAQLRAGDILDEACPLDPEPQLRDPYTYSKVSQELAAREVRDRLQLPLVVVRPGVIYGPGREAITSRVGLRVGAFVLQMGGRQRMPYIYVDNCAKGVLLAGTTPGVDGETFNLVDDELPTGRQVLRLHRRLVGRVWAFTVPRLAVRPLSRLCVWYHDRSMGQIPAVLTPYKSDAAWKRLRYSNAKAKAQLGWTPEVSLEEGLQRTFAWLREAGGTIKN
jgi:nucleoside-diphosphate-sugar epimerase